MKHPCAENAHRWRAVKVMRLSRPRAGDNAVRVYQCSVCGLGKAALDCVAPAKMKGKGSR